MNNPWSFLILLTLCFIVGCGSPGVGLGDKDFYKEFEECGVGECNEDIDHAGFPPDGL